MNFAALQEKVIKQPHSPLFTRLASEYLSRGDIREAKRLCTEGLNLYPRYVTAHVLLGACYAALEEYSAAIECILTARSLFPDSPMLVDLQAHLEGLAQGQKSGVEAPPPEESPGGKTADESAAPEPAPLDLHEEAQGPGEKTGAGGISLTEDALMEQPPLPRWSVPSEEPGSLPAELPLPGLEHISETSGGIAEEIVPEEETAPSEGKLNETPEVQAPALVQPPPTADMPSDAPPHEPLPEETKEFPSESPEDSGRIVSKTMAEIFEQQGEYSEAIITYQLLKKIHPEMSAEIDRRMGELAMKLQAKLATGP